MMTLSDRNEAIDVVTIKDRLEQENLLEDVGGLSYLSDLALAVPTAANVIYYAKIVEQKSLLRNLIQTATEIVTKGFEQGEDVESILDEAELLLPPETLEEELDYIYESNNNLLLLAIYEGTIIGTASVKADSQFRLSHVGEVGISILQEYWGMGLGTLMLEEIIS